MSKTLRLLLPLAGGAAAALTFLGCHAALRPQEPPQSPPQAAKVEEPAREEALAMVDELQLKTHEEFLDDGSVIVSNRVGLSVLRPAHHDRIFVHTQGLPRIGLRRLQLGDVVRFELPDPRWGTDLELSQLRGLRFVDVEREPGAAPPYSDLVKLPFAPDKRPWQGKAVSEVLEDGSIARIALVRAETSTTAHLDVVHLLEMLAGATVFEDLSDGRDPRRFPPVWEAVLETHEGRSLLLRADTEWGCLIAVEGHGCFRLPSPPPPRGPA